MNNQLAIFPILNIMMVAHGDMRHCIGKTLYNKENKEKK